MPGLKQLDGEPRLAQARVEPLRQWTRLKPDPSQRQRQLGKPAGQRLGLARYLRLAHDPPGRVHHTDARLFQRDIDPGIVLHGRPSMMLGAGRT